MIKSRGLVITFTTSDTGEQVGETVVVPFANVSHAFLEEGRAQILKNANRYYITESAFKRDFCNYEPEDPVLDI